MTCDRCGGDAGVSTMSRFNTEQICIPCEDVEKAHPDYEKAREAELNAVRAGDYNYPGIGLPEDLAAYYSGPVAEVKVSTLADLVKGTRDWKPGEEVEAIESMVDLAKELGLDEL